MTPYDYGKWTRVDLDGYVEWFAGHVDSPASVAGKTIVRTFVDNGLKGEPLMLYWPVQPINYIKVDFTVDKI